MLPDTEIENEETEEEEEEYLESSNTCRVNFNDDTMCGSIDGIEAVKQAVFVIMNTERYENLIHSWDFGIEKSDLIGEDIIYVESEIESRIKEALENDDRIESVDEFNIERKGRKLYVSFSVNSIFGSFGYDEEMEF